MLLAVPRLLERVRARRPVGVVQHALAAVLLDAVALDVPEVQARRLGRAWRHLDEARLDDHPTRVRARLPDGDARQAPPPRRCLAMRPTGCADEREKGVTKAARPGASPAVRALPSWAENQEIVIGAHRVAPSSFLSEVRAIPPAWRHSSPSWRQLLLKEIRHLSPTRIHLLYLALRFSPGSRSQSTFRVGIVVSSGRPSANGRVTREQGWTHDVRKSVINVPPVRSSTIQESLAARDGWGGETVSQRIWSASRGESADRQQPEGGARVSSSEKGWTLKWVLSGKPSRRARATAGWSAW